MSQSWNWKEQREKKAFLALEDGTIFKAYSIGADKNALGEAVFGAGKDGRIVAYLTVSTGVGGGLIIDNKLLADFCINYSIALNSNQHLYLSVFCLFFDDFLNSKTFFSGFAGMLLNLKLFKYSICFFS